MKTSALKLFGSIVVGVSLAGCSATETNSKSNLKPDNKEQYKKVPNKNGQSLMLTTESIPKQPVVTRIPGDANGDGLVDILDTAQILSAGKFDQGFVGATWEDGDFNGDGLVDILDTAMMLDALNGDLPQPPPPPTIADCTNGNGVSDPNLTYSWQSRLRTGEDIKGFVNSFSSYTQVTVTALRSDPDTANFVCQLNGYVGGVVTSTGSFSSPADNRIYRWDPSQKKLIPANAASDNSTIKGYRCTGKLIDLCKQDPSWIFQTP